LIVYVDERTAGHPRSLAEHVENRSSPLHVAQSVYVTYKPTFFDCAQADITQFADRREDVVVHEV
jgi:hypothetical protein